MMGYSIIDFETTGLNKDGKDQIIEAAIIRTDSQLNTIATTNFKVALEEGRSLDPFITELTGITEDDLREAIPLDLAKKIISNFISGTAVVAQFASFDLSFIKDIPIERFYCTRSISMILFPGENPSLKPTCERLGIKIENEHRALNDALATKDLFRYQAEKISFEQYPASIRNYANLMVDSKKRPLLYVPSFAKVIKEEDLLED